VSSWHGQEPAASPSCASGRLIQTRDTLLDWPTPVTAASERLRLDTFLPIDSLLAVNGPVRGPFFLTSIEAQAA